ncbi:MULTISPECIES: response regulator transcription factor [Microbacterium]|uniref:Response regulator n=1 Tax=Microbacterium marmarense TaxID=3122051 RepID=A0ABU8LZE0_9MICO
MAAILVVEDDPDVAGLIQMKLSLSGHDVHVAVDGEFGLQAAAERLPDLIILDWMMPRKNGLEVCLELRATERYAQTKILMLTARSEDIDRQRAMDAGADDYFTKPFSPRALAARVDSLIAA